MNKLKSALVLIGIALPLFVVALLGAIFLIADEKETAVIVVSFGVIIYSMFIMIISLD